MSDRDGNTVSMHESAIHRLLAKAWGVAGYSLHTRSMVTLTTLFAVGLAFALWSLHSLTTYMYRYIVFRLNIWCMR